jgi:hypothetical protein
VIFHVTLENAGDGWVVATALPVSIPQHKELSVGTLRALIRAAGISVDEFLELL